MKILMLLIGMLAVINSYASEQSVVSGMVSFDQAGVGYIKDCSNNIKYRIGVMASSPYFKFVNEVETLQKRGNVLVSVKGKLKQGKAPIIDQPSVTSIASGECVNQ